MSFIAEGAVGLVASRTPGAGMGTTQDGDDMSWHSGGVAALGGLVLLVVLPHPNARTAALLTALLVAATTVAGSRVVTSGNKVTLLLLTVGVVLHGITTALRQAGRLSPDDLTSTVVDVLHAVSFLLAAGCLLLLGPRAVARDRGPSLPKHEIELEQELRKAAAAGALSVHYQPIVHARTGQIVSVEALVRWEHPALGLLAPARFLPTAERADLMVEIGRHVLALACADLAVWRVRWPDLALAVNVSERELLDAGFADHVTETLRRHALPTHALHLELTETVTVNEETIAAVLEPLASSGVGLSIDDFGTGHSSLHRLNRLRRLQVQRLKIDKSFVDEIESVDQGAGPLLASMIALAHRVGHSVVAEGVENAAQAAFLARNGCDELQGYLYSRPVPAEDLTALLPKLRGRTPQLRV